METNGSHESLEAQLREVERGEVASWVVYPPTPVWWPVGFGLWAAVFGLVVGLLEGVVASVAELGLIVVMGLLVAWDRRRRGTYPNGRPPRELNPVMARLVLGSLLVAGAAWLSGEQVGPWLAAVVAGAGAYVVVALYEHQYAAVAARIRERLT